jgi:hypothetical protein
MARSTGCYPDLSSRKIKIKLDAKACRLYISGHPVKKTGKKAHDQSQIGFVRLQ